MELSLGPLIISKELILSRVSEETLMEHYVGVPCKKGLFRSPFRTDRNPTCCFFRNKKGELLFKDFGSDLMGNFITIVMHKFSCSYWKALQIIANDFGIVKSETPVNKPAIKYTNTKLEQTQDAIIQVETKDFEDDVIAITGKHPIKTIVGAEPMGTSKAVDLLLVAPCTGNTLSKIANGITDTPVTMAVKATLRNNKPVVLSVSSNDSLGANARNIGTLLNTKNVYFVPFGQDDHIKKPNSLIADTSLILPTCKMAIDGKQIQPIFFMG